jgi:hypothetical protein
MLVAVYWLGGDLGAFYGSTFMTDPRRTVPERLMALKILNNIDMAPRTALILALPSGLTLALAKGWLIFPTAAVLLLWVAGLGWLALAWAVHLRHGAGGQGPRKLDLAIRYVLVAGLAVTAALGLGGVIALPLFIALKCIILAICIALGLLIRRQLVPLFPAIAAMRADGPTPETDSAIAGVISRTRPVVVFLWILVLAACLLGIATPV